MDNKIKIIILGNTNVGKTSILRKKLIVFLIALLRQH